MSDDAQRADWVGLTDLVGLIPAAGQARRLGALPMSKELLPVAVRDTPAGAQVRVAAQGLLELLARGGASRAYVVLRAGKEDVVRFLGRDGGVGLPLAFVTLPESPSLPASLDAAYPFVRGQRVALGFPDVQLGPADAFARLGARQQETGADLVLGLVEPARPSSTDMVALGDGDRVVRIEVRPEKTELRWCWIVAVWGARFTEHLHAFVAGGRGQAPPLHPERSFASPGS